MAISTLIRWQEANSACSIWFSRSVSPASCTLLIWFTWIRIHSGKISRDFSETCGNFVYCLLQKVKLGSDLPVIKKWEAYMLPNHSCFRAIAEEHFLEGSRLLSSLEKINSGFLRIEFRRDCRRFLEDLVSTTPSTVAARSPIGQGPSCFCPEIVTGGDYYSAFHLFGQLLDGLLELGWVRGSEVEPAKAEFHSFVREQRRVETSSHRSRAPINSVFAFYIQPSFRSRRNLHKVGILCFRIFLIVSWFNTCTALDLSVDSTSGTRSFWAASRLY